MKQSPVEESVHKVKTTNKLTQLIILISFLVTFGLIRAVTHLQKSGLLPNQQGAFHIHHMVFGIIFLLIAGYVGLSNWSNGKVRQYVSILFGVGAALTIDEFALWLFLKDVYWAKQGRDSIDAVIIVTVLLVIGYIISAIHNHSLLDQLGKK